MEEKKMFDTFIETWIIAKIVCGFFKAIITIAEKVFSLLFLLIAKAVQHYNEKNDQ